MVQVDDRVKENLIIVATVLAILNNGTQLIEKSIKATKWLAKKMTVTKQKTHLKRQPTKQKRKR